MRGIIRGTATLVTVGLVTLPLAGCGTIFGGSAQEINLSSKPSGATVEFDRTNRVVTTPTEIELKRKHTYQLTFSREGYSTETSVVESNLRWEILILDILFGGVVGVAIDAGTGAWNRLSPDDVSVTLQKQTASAAGPDPIRVRLGVAEADGGAALAVEADEPVKVRIRRME